MKKNYFKIIRRKRKLQSSKVEEEEDASTEENKNSKISQVKKECIKNLSEIKDMIEEHLRSQKE